MNAMTSEEYSRLRPGDGRQSEERQSGLAQQHFDPELWQQSAEQLGEVPALYPPVPGATELVSYNFHFSNIGGAAERSQEFTLVTEGGGRWAVTRFRTFAAGGAAPRVVQWSVVPHPTAPPELAMLRAMDRAVPWLWAGAGFVLLRRRHHLADPAQQPAQPGFAGGPARAGG